MTIIYHIIPRTAWQAWPAGTTYRAESLATEGFIHCTGEPEHLVEVANRYYRQRSDEFVILSVNTEALEAEVRWEEANQHRYPHIYGVIEPGAIVAVTPFPRLDDGTFQQPPL